MKLSTNPARPMRCSWLEPGRRGETCGDPGVVRAKRWDVVRCRRHAPPKPWDPDTWEAIDVPE